MADKLIDQFRTEVRAKGIGFDKLVGTGSYCERLKILFATSDQMWVMLKAMKGLKFRGGDYRDASR